MAADGVVGPPRDPWELPDVSGLTVGVVGGTGEQGRGLATRWATAGLRVIIGSRIEARATAAAVEVGQAIGAPGAVLGMVNADCAEAADVVLVAVPWASHADTVAALAGPLAGKVVIDCVNPLGFDKQGAYPLPVPEGSAAGQAAELLPESRVVAAFHHVSAKLLADLSMTEVPSDVLVLGDDREATDTVQALAALIPGMRGVYAGRLRNAGQVEALTANLISINRRYKAHSSVAVTGV
ncbi:MAG: 8-hydroxy-5-deazaflavin:NADPH oxidoreductase [Actinomycetota bacterium]|nr:8-hydroxy-5-deazaflavin:NADPH oxidoreductase [Actinomycetota bacterium]